MMVGVQKGWQFSRKIMLSFKVMLLLIWCVYIDGQNFDILDELLSQDFPSSPITITIVDDNYFQSPQSSSTSPSVSAPISEIQLMSNQIDKDQQLSGSSQDNGEDVGYVQQDITTLLFQTLNGNQNGQRNPTNDETREFKSTQPEEKLKDNSLAPAKEVLVSEEVIANQTELDIFKEYFHFMQNITGGFQDPSDQQPMVSRAANSDNQQLPPQQLISTNGLIRNIDYFSQILLPLEPAVLVEEKEDASCQNLYEAIQRYNLECRNQSDVTTAAVCLEELERFIEATGAIQSLSNPSLSITVFAPSDAAFKSRGIFANAPNLELQMKREVLMLHSIPKVVQVPQGDTIKTFKINQLLGSQFFDSSSRLLLNSTHINLWNSSAQFLNHNISACGSVIYIIDNLLYPDERQQQPLKSQPQPPLRTAPRVTVDALQSSSTASNPIFQYNGQSLSLEPVPTTPQYITLYIPQPSPPPPPPPPPLPAGFNNDGIFDELIKDIFDGIKSGGVDQAPVISAVNIGLQLEPPEPSPPQLQTQQQQWQSNQSLIIIPYLLANLSEEYEPGKRQVLNASDLGIQYESGQQSNQETPKTDAIENIEVMIDLYELDDFMFELAPVSEAEYVFNGDELEGQL